jgi:hypothetical protein
MFVELRAGFVLFGLSGRLVRGPDLQRAKPGTPVETPRKFELVINNRVAGEIGLKISPEMLMLADRVFR